MRASRFKPTASMVVAIAALVVATSGSAIAAGHLVNGDKLIKKGSLSGNRIHAHSITGKQINLGELGTVPSAATATNASNATTATTAGSAPLSRLDYEFSTATLNGSGPVVGKAMCPAGLDVVGGGARVANENDDFVIDTFPLGKTGWQVSGFGDSGDAMTVYAVCAPAATTTP
jgi:hypothetical protein